MFVVEIQNRKYGYRNKWQGLPFFENGDKGDRKEHCEQKFQAFNLFGVKHESLKTNDEIDVIIQHRLIAFWNQKSQCKQRRETIEFVACSIHKSIVNQTGKNVKLKFNCQGPKDNSDPLHFKKRRQISNI